MAEHLLLNVQDFQGAFWLQSLGGMEAVVAGTRSDLQYPFPGLWGEHLAQPGAGDKGVRQFEREAQAIWAG